MNQRLFVIMGVAGSGKSAIGSALAEALAVDFVEGDDFHSPENIAKMAAGVPLTDEDRAGWLGDLADRLTAAKADSRGLVIACSALKRSYRDVLRAAAPDVQFVFLNGPRKLIERRLSERSGHFMSAAMLDSQFAILEEPAEDENAWALEIRQTPKAIVADLLARAAP